MLSRFAALCSVIVFVAACAVGDDPGQAAVSRVTTTTSTTSSTLAAPPPTVPDAAAFSDFIDLAVADIEAYWRVTLPAQFEVDYEGPSGGVRPYRPSTGTVPDCGDQMLGDVAANNAFYCIPDDFIAWDEEQLFPSLYDRFGDFALALVLAHEWGHLVQNRIDFEGRSIVRELQADCFAGAWAGQMGSQGGLAPSPGDIDEAVAGYLLFRDPPQASPDDPGAHGSTFDRVGAFLEGFELGVEVCGEYGLGSRPVIVDVPFTQDDVITGGDLDFARVAGTLGQSLDDFWIDIGLDVYGLDYASPAALVAYDPARQSLVCGGAEVTEAERNAFYCASDDVIAWDEPTLFLPLYRAFGDMAPGIVLSTAWAERALTLAGRPDGEFLQAEADCLSGAWVRWIFDGNDLPLRLSAGDLDEAIGSLLVHPRPTDDMAAFERVAAFQTGFFDGAESCAASSGSGT